MALQIKYCFAIIFLLSFTAIKSDQIDFKTQFGEEFGTALKQYNAEMSKAILDNFTELYNTLLRDLKGTEEHNFGLRMRLSRIQRMKNEIGDSITAETLRKSKNLINAMLFEIVDLYKSKFVSDDAERTQVIKDALKVCNEKEQAGAKLFLDSLRIKWRSMFKTIPAEELQNHNEYTEINDLMEKTNDEYMDMVKTTAEIWRKVTEFFDYEEYKQMFTKQSI